MAGYGCTALVVRAASAPKGRGVLLGRAGSFARLPRVIRAAMHWLDESSTKSPAQAELGPGTQYPQKFAILRKKFA